MIAVRLIDVILTMSETRAFLSIENESEKDLHLYPMANDFIAIQNKTQFIARKVLFNEKYFPPIPPGIAETLVVRFEGVDPNRIYCFISIQNWVRCKQGV